jgi:TonB family protein
VEIGDIPSDKRVECRFGMDYYIPVVSKKSFAMLKNVVEGSFYKNSEVSDANFARLFPGHNFTLDASVTDVPAAKNQELKRLGLVSKSSSSKNNSSIVDPQVTNPPSILKTPVEVLSKATPVFPRAAKRRDISGVVELVYKVSESGQAIDIKIIKEEPIGKSFGDASMAAIEQYRFKPATENGIRITSDERKLIFRF